ncbi:hypothetical protein FB567DRAFT_603342 [Paraphoma chrysanthemicola]|uniref:BTB domain-containing protein n=1 Tax=Paraphoma chrysanthemicola TaxID=798071 RepID=A0A8K0VXR8_9PLEO|nr:hypothetical protein FB567DRAFT_603342 [Paraphoma chrysanthemicola]
MSATPAPDSTKKIYPPVELPKCPYATEPPSPDDYGDVINIVVGEGATKRTFAVYEGLLKHYSSYFKTALKKEWAGEDCRMLELPDDDPEALRAFFNWTLTKKLYPRLAQDGSIPLCSQAICMIYIFGDMRGIPELCNAAIDLLFQKHCQEWSFVRQDVQLAYGLTMEGSALRKFFVNDTMETYIFTTPESNEGWPQDFLLDVLKGVGTRQILLGQLCGMSKGKWIHTRKLEICSKYHDHSGRDI